MKNSILKQSPVKATQSVNFARVLPLFGKSEAQLSLLAARRTSTSLQLRTVPRKSPTLLQSLPSQTFALERATGTLSPEAGTSSLNPLGTAELQLPPGMPRFVNAATLKKMLRSKRSDLLLRRSGDQWEVVENSARIDLLDDSVEFRLGAIQIYS